MTFYYLATPYTRYPRGIGAACADACEQAAVLIRAGVPVFSPIAHTHPIAMHSTLDPIDLELWLAVDRPMMEAAKGIIMCCLPSWQDSRGMEHEREFFASRGRPVIYMEPGVVPLALRVDPKQITYEKQARAWRASLPVAGA